MKVKITYQIAMAISQDTANQHMRRHGRKKWNADDAMIAIATFDRLLPNPSATWRYIDL